MSCEHWIEHLNEARARIAELERHNAALAEALRRVVRVWSDVLADGPMELLEAENIMHASMIEARNALAQSEAKP